MKLGKTCLPIFLFVLVLGSSGCRRDEERPPESDIPEVVSPPLTETERNIKKVIDDAFVKRHSRWPYESILDIKKDLGPILQSCSDDIDRKKIFRQFRQDILALSIRRCTNEVQQGATWRRSLEEFLDYTYGSIILHRLLFKEIDFEDLVFDLKIVRRLEKELAPPFISTDGRGGGWPINDPLETWTRRAFNDEGSDLYVYWLRASPEERKRVMKWFVNHGGRVPDWAH